MTQEATNYAIWKPEHDGHAPPNWREGMEWSTYGPIRSRVRDPLWHEAGEYHVPAEALNSPNDDASDDVDTLKRREALKEITRLGEEMEISEAVSLIRKLPEETLAKHGITLAPEKDWATELWADLYEVRGMPSAAKTTREGRLDDEDQAAIALIRERVVLKGEA